MKVPRADRAVVPEAKVYEYLLSPTHPLGRHKARLFARLGYSLASGQRLIDDLLHIVRTQPVVERIETPYGVKYVVDGEVISPAGERYRLRSVWVIEHNLNFPRLVTAYPLFRQEV